MKTEGVNVDPSSIRGQLRRILASDLFAASSRNKRFLKFIVEETLEGRAERIKAYTIGTTILGRSENFDPQTDSIVRIEASRLRRSLEHYYLISKDDQIRIGLPKGGYVPTFVAMEGEPAANELAPNLTDDARGARKGPRIFVSKFETEGDHSAFPSFAHDLMRRIILGLTRFTEISVFGSDTTISFGSNTDRSRVRTELDADFLLVGAATASGNNISVSTTLVDAITGQYLWAERFDRKILPDGILGIGDDVANTVVRHLAQPFGIVFSRVLEREGPLPKHLASYDCVARYYHYCRQYDPEYLDTLIGDLEKAVSEDQRYSEAFACLSQAYSNAVRFNHDVSWTTNEPIRRALELADRAVELAPHSSLAFHARGLAYWYSGDTDACMKAFEHGRRLNPNDTDLMAELGHRYALLADWESAIPLLEESYQYNPGQSGVFRVGLSIYHHVAGRYERALTEAKKAGAPTLVYSFLLIAMSAAKLGRNDEAEAAVKKIREIDAHYGDHIVEDLTARHLHPDLIEIVVEGVRQAGLKASQVELAAARLTRR